VNDELPPLPPYQSANEFERDVEREYPDVAKAAREQGKPNGKGNGGSPPSKRIEVTMGSNVTPEPISFAWPGWLAYGKLHINAGRPGAMKTTTAMDWAATFTRGGQWPDGSRPEQGQALIWSGEDAIDDTLLPRFMAAGGDRSEIGFISGVEENSEKRPFDPARDMDGLAAICGRLGRVKLVVIDPIVATSKLDSHRNAETRRDLQPLVDLGEQTKAVILGIHHLTKRSENDDPLDRVSGSLAYGAAPRMVLLSALDPAQAEPHGVVMRAKSNIGPPRGGFAFKAEMRPLDGYSHISAQRILWGDYLDETARDILTRLEGGATNETGMRKGALFLRDALKDGPKLAAEVIANGEAAGFNERALRRALKKLGGSSEKLSLRTGWIWTLPGQAS
jgi:putative DNA primase/helicase